MGDGVLQISQVETQSRWTPAPPPATDDAIELGPEFEAEQSVSYAGSSVGSALPSSVSISTGSLRSFPMFANNLMNPETPASTIVAVTLAIAVPISMFLGAVLATMLMSFMRR